MTFASGQLLSAKSWATSSQSPALTLFTMSGPAVGIRQHGCRAVSGTGPGQRIAGRQPLLNCSGGSIRHPNPTRFNQPQWSNAAERVVRLQSRLRVISPAPLATIPFDGTSFTLREPFPADTEPIPGHLNALRVSRELIEIMGRVTAYAHLKGSGRQGAANADHSLGFAGEFGWCKRVLDYAQAYSQQVESDYRDFTPKAGQAQSTS